jgi:bifunctional non-homologous end joining protein LigD
MYEFSLPTKADKVPTGSDWIHEIKYDGYRMMLIREQDRVRLVSRGGRDWADRFPLIESGALKLPEKHFVIDGEVVVLKKDGVSDFDALASRQHDKRAQLYAFDVLACDGEDFRGMPLSMRKAGLAELLSDDVDGIFIAEYEQGAPNASKARLATSYSASPATWVLKGSSQSASIAPMALVGANIGSRSRTQCIRLTAGSGRALFDDSHTGRRAKPCADCLQGF